MRTLTSDCKLLKFKILEVEILTEIKIKKIILDSQTFGIQSFNIEVSIKFFDISYFRTLTKAHYILLS